MKFSSRPVITGIVIAATGLGLGAGGATFASAGRADSEQAITACMRVKTGDLRLATAKKPCVTKGPRAKRERSVSWNKRGIAGVAGAEGPAGEQGLIGAPGPTGAQGPAGATGPQGAQGISGETGPSGMANLQSVQEDFVAAAMAPGGSVYRAFGRVSCPTGTKIVGGGMSIPAGSVTNVQNEWVPYSVIQNRPDGEVTWTADVYSQASFTLRVIARCA